MTTNIAPKHSFMYSGARMNIYHANKGEGLARHEHTYAHGTFCMAGSVIVRKSGVEMAIDKNTTPLNLVAGEWHELEAAEDGTVFCNVFAEEFTNKQEATRQLPAQ
jgi:quercetin dioxygenase-like cupin family protein